MTALDPSRSWSVVASAGTGKTHRLVGRVLRLLLAGANPGGILAVTFTRKAAAEMRQRVSDALGAWAGASDAELAAHLRALELEPDDTLLARARGLYAQLLVAPFAPRAVTLHAFCQDLLSRFPLEAGVSPGFRLIEQESVLLDAAWRRLVRQLSAGPDSAGAQALENPR